MASSKPLMSDTEIRRRKKLQAKISQTTGAIGLGALGATAVASRPGRKALRTLPKVKNVLKAPPPRDPKRDRIKGGITPALAIAAGLGGIGSFNFAAYTRAESEKRKRAAPVKKRDDEMAPIYGEVAKAWTPQTKPYDPERNRRKRNSRAQTGLMVGGGATAGVAGLGAGTAIHERRSAIAGKAAARKTKAKLKAIDDTPLQARPASDKKYKKLESRHKRLFSEAAKSEKLARTTAKTAGKVGAVGAAAVGTGVYLGHRKNSKSWEPYAKRDACSAFGVDHA